MTKTDFERWKPLRKERASGRLGLGLACMAARVFSCQCACHVHKERACRAALRSPPHKSIYAVRTRRLTFTGGYTATDAAGVLVGQWRQVTHQHFACLTAADETNYCIPVSRSASGSYSRHLPASTSFLLSLLLWGYSRHCSIQVLLGAIMAQSSFHPSAP